MVLLHIGTAKRAPDIHTQVIIYRLLQVNTKLCHSLNIAYFA